MNELFERLTKMSPKRLALLALELQAKVDALEKNASSPASEPIAVIGMACRFPGGANDPDAFWKLLRDGTDAITTWDRSPVFADQIASAVSSTPATQWGGFLSHVDQFDPQFFGISPREAVSMDPQQRLALEVAWEAVEHAGYAPDQLTGSSTGVFIGICNSDYWHMQLAQTRDSLNMYTATGSAHSIASGRISYTLGLQGPSVSVDTACSSSLVALHLAVASLRNHECQMALTGGINLILSLDTTLALSRANMLARDGRCKTFDASADGFVRSEGAGLVVLKRLADALRDRDPIWAVIRGSALNQDGRSNGLTAPNGPSQEAVIRAALRDAGIPPGAVGYVETHGTGTELGDPIEVQALGAVYGKTRSAPLMLGSVKTNLGHTEATAGIAGVIKTVLALRHGAIPPHLHFKEPNPYIPWDQLSVTIPTTLTPWNTEPRIAAVSSFGFSGTNAHVILEQAPPPTQTDAPSSERPFHIVTLAAKTENALRELTARYTDMLSTAPTVGAQLPELAYTTNLGRSHFQHRLALVAQDTAQMLGVLREKSDRAQTGIAPTSRVPEVVFLFTGAGAQYVDMGKRLYATQPVYRQAIDRCDEILRQLTNESLIELLQSPRVNDTQFTQPALFAVEYALAMLWQSWGIKPSAVAGHSTGEYVAATIAGVFRLEDGLKLVAERGRLMASLPTNGEMAAVFANEARVTQAIAPHKDRVALAAINWQDSVVISGEKNAVQNVLDALQREGVRARKLAISLAAHSPLMEPILDEFERVAATVQFSAPQIELISGMTGQIAHAEQVTNARYWREHLRNAVRFAACIETLHQRGYTLFVEIGPAPTLIGMGQRCVSDPTVTWIPSLRPGRDDDEQMLTSLATLYVNGVEVDWAGLHRDHTRARIALPTYPFQRERYWFESRPDHSTPALHHAFDQRHPLLGRRLTSPLLPAGQTVFETPISAEFPAFLDHHRIFGMAVLPSPAYIEMVLAGAEATWGAGYHGVDDLMINEALLIDHPCVTQLVFDPTREFKIFSQSENAAEWTCHATGRVHLNVVAPPFEKFPRDEIRARCRDEIAGADYYERLHALGLEFGEKFRGITRLWRREGEALGEIALPPMLADDARAYHIHPAFLDACFHLLGAPLPDSGDASTYLLIGMDHFALYAPPPARVWNHTILRSVDARKETFDGDVRLYDDAGTLIAQAAGLHLKRATRQALERITHKTRARDWFYQVDWQLKPSLAPLAFAAPSDIAERLRPQLDLLRAEQGLDVYKRLLPELDALTSAYIQRALGQLGWNPPLDARGSTDALAKQLGIAAPHRRLFARLLDILAEDGILRREGDEWIVAQWLDAPIAPLAAYPGCDAEIALTQNCGEQLADALTGKVDPLQLLFPNGSFALTEKLYQESPFARVYNTLIQRAVAAAIESLPAGRTLRVLEIGAGTGATTASVLSGLPVERTEYVFTDVSSLFLARAKEKFRTWSFIRYQSLDIERDPQTQDFAAHQFDLILAANVVHATSHLRQTLTHVLQLLAPGGMLLLLEGTARERWVDITFGLTEGWWKFADTELRRDYPLLNRDAWIVCLRDLGFVDVALIPETNQADRATSQSLIIARAPRAESSKPSWLILADANGFGTKLAAALETCGQCAVLSNAGNDFDAAQNYAGVIDLRALDLDRIDVAAIGQAEGAVLRLVQHMHASGSSSKLWLVTRHAQPVGSFSQLAIFQAPLWGLGRVIALEHPELWGGLIDLDAAGDVSEICAELLSSDGEDQIAWRNGQRYVARLAPMRDAPRSPAPFHSDAAYLITGGLGGLGLKIARWMIEQGARQIVLVGRSGVVGADAERKRTAVRDLEALGATITAISADVSDRAQMKALFERFGRDLPLLRGIIHAAVAMTHFPIQTMPLDALQAMMRAKVAGTLALDELSRAPGVTLDFFALFSSTTALWGSRELAHYAAANTFLDAFAHHRRAQGLPAVAINWGAWDEMRVVSAEEKKLVQQFGLNPLPAAPALEILGNTLASDLAQIVVASVNWELLKPAYEAKRARPFLALIGNTAPVESRRAPVASAPQDARPELLRRVESARQSERLECVTSFVRQEAARVLGIDPSRQIDEEQGLFEMGMDSLMSVELKSRLEKGIGQALPSTLTFNYPTIHALAEYLLSLLAPVPAMETAPTQTTPITRSNDLSEDELAALLEAKLGRMR